VFSSKAGIWLVTARELYQMFVSNKPKFERCANTYILAIDELGTEETDFCEYGNRYKPIEQLLSYRYDKMLPTIITTNLPMADIRPKYGDRLAERLNELMEVVHMPDINFRKIH
jgi:DNA replication protein DnaC